MNFLKTAILLTVMILLSGCANYRISTQSLVSQMKENQKIKKSALTDYPSNNLQKIKCEDKNGNKVWLYPDKNTEFIIVKKSDGKKVQAYFDTVILQNDTLFGLKSRLLGGLRIVPVSDIDKITISAEMPRIDIVQYATNQTNTNQTNNSINLEFGSTYINFKIKEATNFSMSSWASSLSFYSTLSKETQLKSPNFISFKYGIGVSKQMTEIYPDIHLNKIANFKDFPYDSIRVYDVAAWDYRINVPLIAQITLFKPFPTQSSLTFPGLKFKIGIINEMTVKRENVDNLLYAYKTETGNLVKEHYEEALNKQVSKYYSQVFGKYDMVGVIGLELFEDCFNHIRVGMSGTYCGYFISPINHQIKTNSNWGISGSIFLAYIL